VVGEEREWWQDLVLKNSEHQEKHKESCQKCTYDASESNSGVVSNVGQSGLEMWDTGDMGKQG